MARTILLADDDKDDVELFQEAILEVDPETIFHSVYDGRQVFLKIESKTISTPDVIFLDINMPEMNGWECLKKLKQMKSHANIPIIIYSTSSLQKDRRIASELGAAFFLTKPDRYKDLITILRLVMDNLNGDLTSALSGY